MFVYNVIICLELFSCTSLLEIPVRIRHISSETHTLIFGEGVIHKITKLSEIELHIH